MSRTSRSDSHDEAFKRRVAKEFDRALREARTKQKLRAGQFAQKLGITRAGLYKILSGTVIPSLQVLRRARKYWGISLSYGELGDGYIRARRADPRQTEFQFSLADVSQDGIHVAGVSPKGERSLELIIRIDFSKTA